MEPWLITWMPAGRNFLDRFVTVLPSHYEPDDVVKVTEAILCVATLTPGEVVGLRGGAEMQPRVIRSIHAHGYVRIVAEYGWALEARRVRNLRVEPSGRGETVTWEERSHDGEWLPRSLQRRRTEKISFEIE